MAQDVLTGLRAERPAHAETGPTELCRRFRRAGVQRVAIERPDGPAVDALMAAELEAVVVSSRSVEVLKRLTAWLAANAWCGRTPAAELLRRLQSAPAGLHGAAGVSQDSVRANRWADRLHRQHRASGDTHPHATRVLARARLRVIWRRRQDRVACDPAKHRALQALRPAA